VGRDLGFHRNTRRCILEGDNHCSGELSANASHHINMYGSIQTTLNITNRELAVRGETKKTAWSESASELYRPSDRRLLAK
jgi:hypothetical protein